MHPIFTDEVVATESCLCMRYICIGGNANDYRRLSHSGLTIARSVEEAP